MFHLFLDSLRHLVGQPFRPAAWGPGSYSGHVWKEVAVSVRAAPVDHPAWSHGRPGEEEGDGREAGAGAGAAPGGGDGSDGAWGFPALDRRGCRSGWDQHNRRQQPEGSSEAGRQYSL